MEPSARFSLIFSIFTIPWVAIVVYLKPARVRSKIPKGGSKQPLNVSCSQTGRRVR